LGVYGKALVCRGGRRNVKVRGEERGGVPWHRAYSLQPMESPC